MKLIFGFFLLVFAVVLTGCGGNSSAQDQNHVSTIPWNKPEKWEGTGALGGMVPNTQ